MKICVIGYSGAGKSRLAISLAKHYFVPVLHLDNLRYITSQKVISDKELKLKIDGFLDKNKEKGWVVDGNYFSIGDERRFKEADLVIFLSYPRMFCYKKAKERSKSKDAVDLNTNPCLNNFDLNYVNWLLFGSRTKKMRDLYQKYIDLCPKEKLVFKTEDELNTWLNSLKITKE
jgi:adenylate kinase family enzyme